MERFEALLTGKRHKQGHVQAGRWGMVVVRRWGAANTHTGMR